jgi:hypothetical protein
MADPTIIIDTQPISQLVKIGLPISFSVVAHPSEAATLAYQWYHDGKAIVSATSDTYTIADVDVYDAGIYKVIVSCNVGTNTATSNNVVLASSILDFIELNIAISILGMTKTGGYNFDWKAVNEDDESMPSDGISSGGYPRSIILSPEVTCMDDPGGASGEAYTNEVLFIIDSKAEQLSVDKPNFAIRSHLRLMFDDLLMLFGNNVSVNGSCKSFRWTGKAKMFSTDKNDTLHPSFLRTEWKSRFDNDRKEPIQYASS